MSLNAASSSDQMYLKCQDKLLCLKLEFNEDVCSLDNIREDCCDSCKGFCQDQPECQKYTSIENLCKVSFEVQKECPDSCGFCSKKESNGIFRFRFLQMNT